MKLRAPFPWFGGKSRAAHLVWSAFGDVPNYIEPFAGSLAVLLARPTAPRVETVNDLDCYLANFWRAVQAAPADVARWADWPVNEADLHARHRWLVGREEFRRRLKADPEYFDAKVAGWWVWGLCQWIGSGWCSAPEWQGRANAGRRARGVHTADHEQRPDLTSSRGMFATKAPKADRGTASRLQTAALYDWMDALQARLRRVRVCCGDWSRIVTPSVTTKIGVTGVFLDPPYSGEAGRDPSIYTHDDLDVAHQVREWAIANGDDPKLSIALCGYEGEHDMPASWQCVPWKANGGYAASAGNHENAKRERIWFSPHCQRVGRQRDLFSPEAA